MAELVRRLHIKQETRVRIPVGVMFFFHTRKFLFFNVYNLYIHSITAKNALSLSLYV